MNHPRFSIVIPARERAATLQATLQSCLAVEHDSYEVVVFDNASGPEVRAAVDAQAHPRLRYVRCEQLLAMTESWNTAVAAARGEWVLVIGNDDAVLPHALREIDAIVARHPVRAVKWATATYTWPDLADRRDANLLSIPLARELRRLNGIDSIRQLGCNAIDINVLPGNYHGAVHRDILEKVRQQTGQVYCSAYPDTYSCVAFAWVAGEFVYSSAPLSIYGLSACSNNMAARLYQSQNPVGREFLELNRRDGLTTHPWFPDFGIVPTVVPDAFLQAKMRFFPDRADLVLDRRVWTELLVRTLWMPNPDDRRRLIAIVRDHLRDDPKLLAWFDDNAIGELPSDGEPRLRHPFWGYDGEKLWLDTTSFAITDIFQATKLCVAVTGGTAPLVWNVLSRTSEREMFRRHIRDLQQQCQSLLQTLESALSCLPYRWVRSVRRWLKAS
ncbi:MAG: glycosyltransferase family 2 protein [Gemmataceae bacterium]|nr:glycosyltransferase [Gemmata sp.]MDW8197985.1 glycosyltransferase family 2 protein [Gemmataceae bacterium]